MGKEHIVERAVGIQENLPARAADVFELRRKSLENAIWQGKQKPVQGPFFVHTRKPRRVGLVPLGMLTSRSQPGYRFRTPRSVVDDVLDFGMDAIAEVASTALDTVGEMAIAEILDWARGCHTKGAMGIKVKCDSCGALLDTRVESGAEARYIAKRAGWISEDGLTASDEGKDFCPNCRDTSSVEDKPKQ